MFLSTNLIDDVIGVPIISYKQISYSISLISGFLFTIIQVQLLVFIYSGIQQN